MAERGRPGRRLRDTGRQGADTRGGVGGCGSPYQVEHRLHDVPVADLADLYESDQNGEFHTDVADRHRRVDHPRRQHHRAGARAGRPPRFAHGASTAAGPDGQERDGLRLEPRARLVARHPPRC